MTNYRFLLFFILLLSCINIAATKRALVIGIGDYPEQSGWNKINGDKDIPYVEKMLVANGFKKKDITTLKNAQATYSAICSAMEGLVGNAQKGDFVYIHFSGHGQQITDLNGDEQDRFDEAWVPYDAYKEFVAGKYEGEHHITDDRLNEWLYQIRQKTGNEGKIIVVADACHSGEITRGSLEDDSEKAVIRGTADNFVIPSDRISGQSQHTPHPLDWITISACKSYQCNYEYNGMGSLTYALYQEYKNFSSMTNAQLHQKVRTNVQQVVKQTQTPVVEFPAEEKTNIFF